MAYKSCDKLRRSELQNNASAKGKVQAHNLNQIKLIVNDTYGKDEKLTTKFELSDVSDVKNKAQLDKKFQKQRLFDVYTKSL